MCTDMPLILLHAHPLITYGAFRKYFSAFSQDGQYSFYVQIVDGGLPLVVSPNACSLPGPGYMVGTSFNVKLDRSSKVLCYYASDNHEFMFRPA